MANKGAKAMVTDCGDPTVGIFPQHYFVDCPFFNDEDKDNIEFFRKKLEDLYGEFADGRIVVVFDFEIFLTDTDGMGTEN